MSRVIRLLIAKALWLYGFALILPYLCFLCLIALTPSPTQTENIFYPALIKQPTIEFALIVTLILVLGSISLHAIKARSVFKWFGLLLMAVVITTLGMAFFGPAVYGDLRHEDSLQVDNTVYHLAAYGFSSPYPDLDHILYACDTSGLWCRVVEDNIRSRYGRLTLNFTENGLELVEYSGEVRFTYQP